jgi:NADH-quinone oxidoreductase subunit B/C/D
MVIAGTITTKMAPRVKKLWDQMPEPKWAIAMGSCAISGDFYRNLYSVVPGVDTFMPVDVYVPGCPPNPEGLMAGMLRLQQLVQARRRGEARRPADPALMSVTNPSVPRLHDPARPAGQSDAQVEASRNATAEQMLPPEVVPMLESTAGSADAPGVAPLVGKDFAALLQELGVTELPKEGPPLVPVSRHLELARRLKADGYRQYVSVIASHFLAGIGRKGKDAAEPEHFEVTTMVRSIGAGSRLATWTVRLGVGETLPSLAGVYAGADWQEREQYDLLGVKFAGHPDLRRLMMAENYPGHPLRRDFPVNAPQAPWR